MDTGKTILRKEVKRQPVNRRTDDTHLNQYARTKEILIAGIGQGLIADVTDYSYAVLEERLLVCRGVWDWLVNTPSILARSLNFDDRILRLALRINTWRQLVGKQDNMEFRCYFSHLEDDSCPVRCVKLHYGDFQRAWLVVQRPEIRNRRRWLD
jgi:hypothetical protein